MSEIFTAAKKSILLTDGLRIAIHLEQRYQDCKEDKRPFIFEPDEIAAYPGLAVAEQAVIELTYYNKMWELPEVSRFNSGSPIRCSACCAAYKLAHEHLSLMRSWDSAFPPFCFVAGTTDKPHYYGIHLKA